MKDKEPLVQKPTKKLELAMRLALTGAFALYGFSLAAIATGVIGGLVAPNASGVVVLVAGLITTIPRRVLRNKGRSGR